MDMNGDRPVEAMPAPEVWQLVHDGLRTFIQKRVANPVEVEDLLQEVFLRIRPDPAVALRHAAPPMAPNRPRS